MKGNLKNSLIVVLLAALVTLTTYAFQLSYFTGFADANFYLETKAVCDDGICRDVLYASCDGHKVQIPEIK